MIETKVFFEEGRTIIVVENPTPEQNEMIKTAFCDAAIKQVANVLAVQKIAEEPPKIEDTAKANVKSSMEAARALLKDSKKQKEIGLEKTIQILSEALGETHDTKNIDKNAMIALWADLKGKITKKK